MSSYSVQQILSLQAAASSPNDIAEIRVTGTAPNETTYIGVAPRGSATSDAAWQVKRVVASNSGNDTAVRWSDGLQVFDDYATLNYS